MVHVIGKILVDIFRGEEKEEVFPGGAPFNVASYIKHFGDNATFYGAVVKLTTGESIHIQQRMYHDFNVEPGIGDVLLGEVSKCNDDNTDNRFNPTVGTFPTIEEDEKHIDYFVMNIKKLNNENLLF